MNKPRVSVVTVAFNGAGTIEDALRSVRGQRGVDIEHIVIDGGSSDGTIRIVRESAHQPDVFVSERDHGVYDAMNKGLAAASGDYVGFLNADDFFSSETSLMDLLAEEAGLGTDCVYGDIELVSAKNNDVVVRRWRASPFSALRARLGWQAPHPAFYARRDCFTRWGGFDSSMRISGDYELALRFLLKHSATWTYRPVCVVRMRIGGRSTRSLGGILEGNRECGKAWKQNGLRGGALVPILKPLTKLAQLRLPGNTRSGPRNAKG
jgi:glycosyltransferase